MQSNMVQLPKIFVEQIELSLGDEAIDFFASLDENSPSTLRINPRKSFFPKNLEQVPWCENGYYLAERPVYTLDPLFHAGAYYVQEASSMFLEQVLKQTTDLSLPLKVLDLCAAPGGKTTHIVSLLSNDSLLVSNEVIRSRSKILAENVSKWGIPNIVVTSNDPSDFQKFTGFFDVLIIDAPCSGEGLFRKDKDAVNEWSPENVERCSARQKRIVADSWDALKPGGMLIYSTCTYNRREDEEMIQWICDEFQAQSVPIDISQFTGIVKTDSPIGYHFYPHKIKGEGFFIAALKKTVGQEFRPIKIKKPPISKAPSSVVNSVSRWINSQENIALWAFHNQVLAFPARWSNELLMLTENLSIVQAGTEVCEIKGRDFIPSHALAVSSILQKVAFATVEIDLDTALTFLKKEECKFNNSDDYLLLTYSNVPLGFMKKAGTRYNNLYPKEWRIRMDIR